MKEYEEVFGNRAFTNNEMKKLQEDAGNNSKKQHFINYKLYDIKKRQEKRVKIKESDYINIREKLNGIFKKYYERLSKREITGLDEFYDMIMISFALYEQLENTGSDEKDSNNGKLLEFKNKLKKYNELKIKKSNNRYSQKNMGGEPVQYNEELEKADVQIDQIRKEITQFTDVLLSELWSDYEKFKEFIKEDEKVRTLAQLTQLGRSFEELEEMDPLENYISIRNKLEHYLLDIEEFDFPIDERRDVRSRLENILNVFDKENDIINILLHFSYANILIRSNIMRFPIISEEYRKNSALIYEIRTLKESMISYYRDTLTYRDSIRITDEILENQSDALFYDLLYLQINRNNSVKRGFKTFDNLESPRENQEISLKNGTSEIEVDGDNVLIRCNINDFIQISNSLEMMEKLREEAEQKNFLEFLDKDEEYYRDKKFKLKSRFMSERENILKRIETVTEIEKELLKEGMKLIPAERQLLFSLLEKTSDETGNFKIIEKKMLKNPYFVKKIIKSGSIGENRAYDEFYRDISYIEKINDILTDYNMGSLSDTEESLSQLDSFHDFNFDTVEADDMDKEILEELKEYQKNYRKIAGGEKYAEKALQT